MKNKKKVWPSSSGATTTTGAGGEGREAGALEGLLPLQVLSLPGRGALSLEVDPEGAFVFAADTGEGLLYALHLKAGGQKGYVMYARVVLQPGRKFRSFVRVQSSTTAVVGGGPPGTRNDLHFFSQADGRVYVCKYADGARRLY